MKLIIAGSRELSLWPEDIDDGFDEFVLSRLDVTEVVSGGARGVDDSGEAWAAARGLRVKRFPADWNRYGKAAGSIRNEQMARYADAAILFFKEKPSPGTSNMLAWMTILRKPHLTVVV